MEEYTSTITRHFSTSVTSRFQSSLSIAGLMKEMSTPFFDMVTELGVERSGEAGLCRLNAEEKVVAGFRGVGGCFVF